MVRGMSEYVTHPELNAYTEKIRQIATSDKEVQNRRISLLEDNYKQMELTISEVSKRQHSLELESREILSLSKSADGIIKLLADDLKDLTRGVQAVNDKTANLPLLQRTVFGAAAIMLIGILTAIIGLVLIK